MESRSFPPSNDYAAKVAARNLHKPKKESMPMIGNIDNIDDAWKEICKAAENGTFVPVLAFELSCLPQYSGMIAELKDYYPRGPRQLQQLALQHDRIARAGDVLDKTAANSATDQRAKRYLEALEPSVAKADTTAAASSTNEDGSDLLSGKLFSNLLANLARLATALTRTWATDLMEAPTPMHFGRQARTVPINDTDGGMAILQMRKSLNCCAFLYDRAQKQGEPNSLKIDWIYGNLLLFASEVFDAGLVWAASDACEEEGNCCGEKMKTTNFRNRHLKFIESHAHTGWTRSLTTQSNNQIGVRISHLRFLQGLLKHLLLAGTRAYRSPSELAFLMALDDTIKELPAAAGDPFEMNLLLKTLSDRSTLADVLRYCEGTTSDLHPFFRALAWFLNAKRKIAETSKDVAVRMRAREQVVVSMSLDREMERALAREFHEFRIALPVHLPVAEYDAHETDIRREPVGPRGRLAWLIGNCIRENSPLGYRVESWTTFGGDLSHDGPLVLKLFGSPLEDLTKALADSLKSDSSIDLNGKITHHLVLDENELLSSLFRYLPEHEHFISYLTNSNLFFFGQDALRWSERLPYFFIRSLDAPDGGVSYTHEETSNRIRKSTVSFGEPGVFGAVALRKLKVRFTMGDVRPESVIRRFVEEFARHD